MFSMCCAARARPASRAAEVGFGPKFSIKFPSPKALFLAKASTEGSVRNLNTDPNCLSTAGPTLADISIAALVNPSPIPANSKAAKFSEKESIEAISLSVLTPYFFPVSIVATAKLFS